jgi:hypothetical protein
VTCQLRDRPPPLIGGYTVSPVLHRIGDFCSSEKVVFSSKPSNFTMRSPSPIACVPVRCHSRTQRRFVKLALRLIPDTTVLAPCERLGSISANTSHRQDFTPADRVLKQYLWAVRLGGHFEKSHTRGRFKGVYTVLGSLLQMESQGGDQGV